MIAAATAATLGRRLGAPREPVLDDHSSWTEPGTRQTYPLAYEAYRRAREAEEKMPARHRTLGPDVDHYVWRRRQASPEHVDVLFVVRPDAPHRIRRIVAEILRAIRRGEPAADAIRHVGRRFGLRHTRVRAFLAGSVGFEVQRRAGAVAPFATSF
jgi:hypothetical protein